MLLPLQKQQQRIFISYRRDDTQWVAARLADTLGGYFGEERIFRDIEGISGGADFGVVITETVNRADAVIVLIGKRWLNACDETGQQRLKDSEDWVAQEIAAALKQKVPVYPVLVDDVSMPRSEDLPEVIKPLARYHAVSISDRNWSRDVDQLAKIISLDIPSATENRLNQVNLLISTALFLSLAFTAIILVWNLFEYEVSPEGILVKCDYSVTGVFGKIFDLESQEVCGLCNPPYLKPLELWQSGIIFLVVVPASVLLFVYGRIVDASKRRYFLAAAWVGALGAFTTFVLYYFIVEAYEAIAIFGMASIVAPLMLALLCLSEFRAK